MLVCTCSLRKVAFLVCSGEWDRARVWVLLNSLGFLLSTWEACKWNPLLSPGARFSRLLTAFNGAFSPTLSPAQTKAWGQEWER